MKSAEMVKLFHFVVHEVERLKSLRHTDPEKAAQESARLPSTYDDFPKKYFKCGQSAARQLSEMASTLLKEIPELTGRIRVETLLRPIQIEFSQRVLIRGSQINETLVKEILSEALKKAKSKIEDRIYFFPIYTINVGNKDEYVIGPAKFYRTTKFFTEEDGKLKRSEDEAIKIWTESGKAHDSDAVRIHISQLFALAKQHYSAYRWMACVEIKGAEADKGWEKAREVLEQCLNLLRLSVPSIHGQFIGFIEENPTLKSASYLSLKSSNEFEAWSSSSYSEPSVLPEFIPDFRQKFPEISNVERAIQKVQQWESTSLIEDRLLIGLFWFGEAWKETQLLPKMVKFNTCIESLFSPDRNHEAIAEKIAERLAWLSFPGCGDWIERRETFDKMKRVYAVRSKAVHGDSAVKVSNLRELVHEAENLARLGFFAFAQLLPLFPASKKEQDLNEFFLRLKLEGLERARQVLFES